MNLSQLQETVEDRGAWRAAVHGTAKSPLFKDIYKLMEMNSQGEKSADAEERGHNFRGLSLSWEMAKQKDWPHWQFFCELRVCEPTQTLTMGIPRKAFLIISGERGHHQLSVGLRIQVQSLVRELRSHKLCSAVRGEKKKKESFYMCPVLLQFVLGLTVFETLMSTNGVPEL